MDETPGDHKKIRLDLGERVPYRFLNLGGKVMQCLADMYGSRHGLTLATWKVLTVIGYYAPMSATEVGRRTSLEPDKVTRTVDQLVEQGLVARRQDTADRRRVILTLSAKGKRVNDEVEAVRQAVEVSFLQALSANEIDDLYAMLDKLDSRANDIFAGDDAWRLIVAAANNQPSDRHREIADRPAGIAPDGPGCTAD